MVIRNERTLVAYEKQEGNDEEDGCSTVSLWENYKITHNNQPTKRSYNEHSFLELLQIKDDQRRDRRLIGAC